MKPLFHHSSSSINVFFYANALLMITIINIPTCMCQNDGQYTNCSTAFNCNKDIPDLKYPFWGENIAKYCSGSTDSETELTCEGSVPKITINLVKYRILKWDNTTQKLTVARDDYWSGICAASKTKLEELQL
ncbi:receptor-like protein kinase [Trifolium pratense]|uniref:Receptor-like protein kinase n=1 Tax=Trifolium pratense TaxID=57577 RepID=A0A2K3KEF1_TRIPR|nr:receptor-like protein kinase [Trifolium pratense]